MIPKLMKIGPAEALLFLEKNTMNRNVRDRRVKQYAHDMKEGLWRENGETIKRTRDGDLLDGQHRLWAIIESGVTLDMLVVDGLDPEVMPSIDTGASRSFSDVAKIGGYDHTGQLATCVRWLFWYSDPERADLIDSLGKHSRRQTNSALADYLVQNPEISERVHEAQVFKRANRIIGAGTACAVYALAHSEDPIKAGQFFALLESGTNLTETSPVYHLRERLMSHTSVAMNRTERFALCLKAFRLFIDGEECKSLRWIKTEGIPVVGPGAPKTKRRKR
jgi:hypothetical protein